MPQLPDTSAFGARPQVQPNLGIVSIGAGDEAAMGAVGQQMVRSGATAEAVGDQIFQADKEFQAKAKIEQHKLDTVMAENAYNQHREYELELAAGKEGYSKVTGAAAASTPVFQTYTKRFGDKAKDLADGLSNDNQRQMFNARVAVSGLGFKEGILRHLAKQGEVAADQTWEATKITEGKMANEYWAEPDVVRSSIVRLDAGVDAQAKAKGWDKDYTDAMKAQTRGKIWDTVINQAVANGNLIYANDLYQENKATVDPATAEKLAHKVVDAKQREIFNGYQTNYLAVQDDPRAVKAWLGEVTKNPFLDEGKKNTLIGRGQSQLQVLATRAAAAQAHNDAVATRMVSSINTQILSGREFSPDEMAQMQQAARQFPEIRAQVADAARMQEELRSFRLLPPDKQQAEMNQDALRVKTGAMSDRLRDTKKAVFEAGEKQRQEDPTSWMVQQGIWSPTDLKAKSIDWSDPSKVSPDQVQARVDGINSVSSGALNYGIPFKPLTAPERQVAVATLAKLNPQQRLEYFKQTSRAYGNNVEGYKAHLAQIAPDQPVLATAAIRARYGDTDQRQATAAQIIADGQAILEPNKSTDGKPSRGTLTTQPPPAKLRALFDDQVRNAYQWDAEAGSQTFQVARAAYAKLTESNDVPDRTVVDNDAWKKAMDIATGGVTKYRGRHVVKPWGMRDGEFEDKVDTNIKALASAGALPDGVTRGQLEDVPLIPYGAGRYQFGVGEDRIRGRNGKPLMIDLNNPVMPPKPQGIDPAVAAGKAGPKAPRGLPGGPGTGTLDTLKR